jgi:SSS family solute:Na+ symporter
MSAVYTVDFHKAYINKNLDEKKLVWVGRWTILVLSAVAYVMALYIPGLLVNIGLVALAGTAQVIVPTAGAFFWKRSTVTGAISGLLVGISLLVIFTFVPGTIPGFFAFGGGGLLSLLSNVVVFIVVSSLTKARPKELMDELGKQYNDFYEKKY